MWRFLLEDSYDTDGLDYLVRRRSYYEADVPQHKGVLRFIYTDWKRMLLSWVPECPMWTLYWILYESIWKRCHFRFRFCANINEPLGSVHAVPMQRSNANMLFDFWRLSVQMEIVQEPFISDAILAIAFVQSERTLTFSESKLKTIGSEHFYCCIVHWETVKTKKNAFTIALFYHVNGP